MAPWLRRHGAVTQDLRWLLRSSSVAVVELDRTGLVREWNAAAERLLGWRAADLLGRTLPRAVLGRELELPRLLERLAAATDAPTLQIRCRHRRGRLVQVEFSPVPLYGRLGRIRGVIGVLVDVTGRCQLERRLRYQAEHDSLTQLLNREALLARVASALDVDARAGARTGLLMIDLDGFKEVNDTLGHASGDQLLTQIGPRLLSGTVRSNDIVARLSGDEFAVLLPGLDDVSAAVGVAERVLSALHSSFVLGPTSVDIAASIGLAVAPDHGADPTELLRCADTAMYEAKERATGVTIYRPDRRGVAPTRFRLLGELRRALDRHELVVHYQPKVDIATAMPCGAEALVRWQHPTRGLLSPGEFIPVAETTGLIRRLTDYVLDAALVQARAWIDRGHDIPVSVNLSARGLHDQTLPGRVLAALNRRQVPAELLCLEITETAVMHDPDSALMVLAELAQAGVGVSVDDFGTGYSSMSYLQRLPVSELKVDRSFITGLSSAHTDHMLVRSTVDLGHNLGLRVVAEGVEDPAALAELHQLGCDIAQGFYFAHPMPPEEFISWLAEHRAAQAQAQRTTAVR